MNIKRFVRKNWLPILLIVIVGIVIYNYMYEEGFQSSTMRIGGICPGPSSMATLSGRCPSGFEGNTTTGMCEKTVYECQNRNKHFLNRDNRCQEIINSANTVDPISRIEERNYTCPTGMVSAGNMRCVRTGRYRCPSGFRENGSSATNCIKCPTGSTYESKNTCSKNTDRSKVRGEIRDPSCVVV
jgi:hypothetical protein